jgi:ankyrin repeat protein
MSANRSSSTKSIEALEKVTMDNLTDQQRYANFLNVLVSKLVHGHLNLNGAVAITDFSKNGESTYISNSHTLLTFAIYYGYIDAVKLLLKSGANPNQRDGFGLTPLITACSIKYLTKLKIIKLLMSHNANPTIGDTISHWIPITYLYLGGTLPLIGLNTECLMLICKYMKAESIP